MRPSAAARDEAHTPQLANVEMSVRGEWISVPALQVDGASIVVKGRWLRIATVLDEEWIDNELENPDLCIQTLREHESTVLRADLFTFSQKLPATVPKYSYPMELDSIAAIRLINFKDWWERLSQVTRKNVRRSQKRGVEVKLREFDDKLIQDIVELTQDSPIRQGRSFAHFRQNFRTGKERPVHFSRPLRFHLCILRE